MFGLPLKVIGDIVIAFVIIVGSAIMGIQRVKEWRAKKKGLAGNPTRCLDHEQKIQALEKTCVAFDVSIKGIKDTVEDTNQKVDKLLDLHLKP